MTGHEPGVSHGDTTNKRGRGQSNGSSFLQRQRSLHAQLSRIHTSKMEPPPTSPPPVQRTLTRPSRNYQHHSRQSSANTEKSSSHSQSADSGFASGVIGSPEPQGRGPELSLSTINSLSSQLPSSTSVPSTTSTISSLRSMETISTLGVSQNRSQRRHGSRTRNDVAHRQLETHPEVQSIIDFALEHLFASVGCPSPLSWLFH